MNRLLVVLLLFFSATCLATTKITQFKSDIQIEQNASLLVTETIQVDSDGRIIRHGLTRDFPITYKTSQGLTKRVGFRVLKTTLDGNDASFFVSTTGRYKRIKIGNPDRFLSLGIHTFTLTYRTTEQVGFFKDHDELYWNVTGNNWPFAISQAITTVTLPTGNTQAIQKYTAFTGHFAVQGRAYQVSKTDQNLIFSTTRELPQRNGLTIAVGWKKGVVSEPTASQNALNLFYYYPSLTVLVIGTALILLYYLLMARYVNSHRPDKGVSFPLFKPPMGFTPSALRFIKRMGYDDRILTAAIVSLACKGALQIKQTDSSYQIMRADSATKMSKAEAVLYAKLFASGSVLEFTKSYSEVLRSAVSDYKSELRAEFTKGFFITNLRFYVVGMLMTLGCVAITLLFNDSDLGGIVLLAGAALMLVPTFRITMPSKLAAKAGSVGLILLFYIFTNMSGKIGAEWIYLAMCGVLFSINLVFYQILRRFTEKGRMLVNKVKGFKMFLNATEKERLKMNTAPDRTPELFEKYLPYAIALGVEENWSAQFQSVLLESQYQPNWYVGRGNMRYFSPRFASNFTSAMSSAVATTVSPPGSSSGFGGGGFSGGGGGGGGGGGW